MSKDGTPDGGRAMLSIAETAALAQAGMDELRALLFGPKKRREKQKR